MKVLVTGATGFIGRSIVDSLLKMSVSVITMVRRYSDDLPHVVEQLVVDDLGTLISLGRPSDLSQDEMKQVLKNVDVVIHTAARVHMMDDDVADPLAKFRWVNTTGTIGLARLAAEAEVKRFIFLSSIKVNGEITSLGKPFKSDDCYVPDDPYGLSKLEAEQGLLEIAKQTKMDVVIIRPPLVYGPGVQANFNLLMKLVDNGVPMPLGAINNQRSFVALDNLVSFIIHCIDHPKAANEIFLISDGEDVSTTELLRKLAKVFGQKALLLPVPIDWMRFVAKLIGKGDVTSRLFGSLQVDSSKAKELLGWKEVITMDEQLKKTVDAYLNEKAL